MKLCIIYALVALTGGIGTSPGLLANADILDHVAVAATQTLIQKSSQVAIEGQSLKMALKKASLHIAEGFLSGDNVQKISGMKFGMLKSASQKP